MNKVVIKPINSKFQMLYKKHRYKILHGGRGSAKSWAIVEALLYYACNYKIRILCCREIQKSIKESSYKMILQVMETLSLTDEFDITRDSIVHKDTKSEFLFMGLHSNVTSVQSIADISICWVEEAQSISEESWKVLTPSIRANGSEIWCSLNPYLPTDVICKNFLEQNNPSAAVVEINYTENPMCPQVLLDEAEHMKETQPEMYEHVWLGKYLTQGSDHLFQLGMLLQAQRRNGVTKDDAPIVAGFDVARYGNDASALVIRHHGKILYWRKYNNQAIFDTCRQVMEKLIEYKVSTVVVDANGLGAGAYEKLKEINTAINLTVVEFNSSFKSNDDKLLNARAEVYKALSEWVTEPDSALPPEMDEAVEELSLIKYEFAQGSDRMKITSKDDIKAAITRSTDLSDALAMTMYKFKTVRSTADIDALKRKLFKR